MEDIFAADLENKRRHMEAKEANGWVKHTKEGFWGYNDIALTQQPYIDGPADGTPHYKAAGIDSNGKEYEIIWEVKDNWEQIEDEQEMVEDWDTPAEVNEI